MDNQIFMKKDPGPYKQAPKPSGHYISSQHTHDVNFAKKEDRRKEILTEIKYIKESVNTLPKAYAARKAEQTKNSSFRFFTAASTERPDEIDFITSIAKSLQAPIRPQKINLHTLRKEVKNLEDTATTMQSIINGACFYVLHKIAEPYKNAWISNDPKASQLYCELTERMGINTDNEQAACLNALKSHLQTQPAQGKVIYGAQTQDAVLAKMDDYIKALSASSSSKNEAKM